MISVQTRGQAQFSCGPISASVFGVGARGVFPAGDGRAASSGGAPEEEPAGDGAGGAGDAGTLEDAARGEREYARGRVREELGREPTEEEVNEWVREHTEGY
jgi:hypothetical protein